MLKKSAAETSPTPKGIGIFGMLGRFAVRAPWLMIAGWVAVVVVLGVAFPR